MNDPSNLAVEIRRLRESIDLLSDAINRGEKLADKISRQTKFLENALENPADYSPLPEFKRTPKSLYGLMQAVAMQWGVTPDQIKSDRRTRVLTHPRFAFCHIAHIVMSYGSPAVANYLGNRDPTTILHACGRTVDLLKEDEKFAANYNAVFTAVQASQTPTSLQQH